MPQIHEITKHIVDIKEKDNLVAIDEDFTIHQEKYQKLYGNLKKDMDDLILELQKMKSAHPELADRLVII
jgi:hypothetical protein